MDRAKALLTRASAFTNSALRWAWENKPFVVAVVIGVEAGMNAYGVHIPPWLVGVDAALGVGALHSAQKMR